MTLLSVIIPFYQKEKNILRNTLNSILGQNIPQGWDVEVIIVDDGSPISAKDEVTKVAQRDGFVFRIIEQSNLGVSGARNRALKEISVHSPLVAFLDSDDLWPPNHLANAIIAYNLGYDLCFTDNSREGFHLSYLNSCSKRTIALAQKSIPQDGVYALPSDKLMSLIIEDFPCQLSTVTFRKSALGTLRFDGVLHSAGEDMLFMIALANQCKLISCNLDIVVKCGEGINMYFNNFSWDSPKFIYIQFDKLKCHYFISQLPNLPPNVAETNNLFLRNSIKDYLFHMFRHILKNQGRPPKNILAFIKLLPRALKAAYLK